MPSSRRGRVPDLLGVADQEHGVDGVVGAPFAHRDLFGSLWGDDHMRLSRAILRRSDTRVWGGSRGRGARNPLRVPSLHTNRGAKRAREARARLGLDAAAPLGCVLIVVEDDAKVPVVVGSLPDEVAGASGDTTISRWSGSTGARTSCASASRSRTSTGTSAAGTGDVRGHAAMLAGETHDPVEVQANAFAAEFLAPRAGMEAAFGSEPTLEDVVTGRRALRDLENRRAVSLPNARPGERQAS